jgi:hypothetical protein
MTAKWGLVKAHDHIVCVQQIHDSFVISEPLSVGLAGSICSSGLATPLRINGTALCDIE